MKSITVEQLSAYLPYELQFVARGDKWQLTSLSKYDHYPIWANNYWDEVALEFYPRINVKDNSSGRGFTFKEIKPILRPLSDLTKEIEHNGEKFVPYERIKELYSNTPQFAEYKENWLDVYGIMSSKCEYVCVLKLFEWHFDVFGLREKNLCVYYNEI